MRSAENRLKDDTIIGAVKLIMEIMLLFHPPKANSAKGIVSAKAAGTISRTIVDGCGRRAKQAAQ